MNPICINCVFKVTKSKSSYFVESVKINSNKEKTVNYLFRHEDQPLHHHLLVDKLVNRKKSKQIVYLTLEGDDVSDYFELATQKFKFNDVYLLPEEDEKSNVYNVKVDPVKFLEAFNRKHSKKAQATKIQSLMKLIEDEADRTALLPASVKGFEGFSLSFIEYFGSKHRDYCKELLNFNDSETSLSSYCQKKLNYFNSFLSIKFDQILQIIELNLNETQQKFLRTMKVSDSKSLIDAATLYDKIKASNPNALGNELSNNLNSNNQNNARSIFQVSTVSNVSMLTPITYSNAMDYQSVSKLMDYEIYCSKDDLTNSKFMDFEFNSSKTNLTYSKLMDVEINRSKDDLDDLEWLWIIGCRIKWTISLR